MRLPAARPPGLGVLAYPATCWAFDEFATHFFKKGESIMKLSQPKVVTWWIGLILAVLAALGAIFDVAILAPNAIWFALVSAVLMLLATLLKGL
jgi:hypothetical protein